MSKWSLVDPRNLEETTVQAAIRKKANLTETDAQGRNCLHLCAQSGKKGLVHLFIQAGANVNAADNSGVTPLMLAADGGHVDIVFYLLEQGANACAIDKTEGRTALHRAALIGHPLVVQCLVANSQANPHRCVLSVDREGNLAADLAKRAGHYEIASYLSNLVANPLKQYYLFVDCNRSLVVPLFVVFAHVAGYVLCGPHQMGDPLPLVGLLVAHVLLVAAFVCYYRACRRHPGPVMSANTEDAESGELWDYSRAGDLPVCHTCSVRKPLRSKHCNICGTCVARFDRHSVWINNCVGAHNHQCFVLWMLFDALFCLTSALLLLHQCAYDQRAGLSHAWQLVFGVVCLVLSVFVYPSALRREWQSIRKNLTTHEQTRLRAPYQWEASIKFTNPFDKGPMPNLHEFFFPTIDWSRAFCLENAVGPSPPWVHADQLRVVFRC